MNPVPFKWTFRAKQLDNDGRDFLYKARYVLRGDKQEAYVDFDPDNLYAPVATHESLRALLSYAASKHDIVEGA